MYKNLDGKNLASLLNFKLNPQATDPASPVIGVPWFNTSTGKFKYYDGTAVRVLAHLDDLLNLASPKYDSGSISVSSFNVSYNYNLLSGNGIQWGSDNYISPYGAFGINNSGFNTLYNGKVEVSAVVRIQGNSNNAGLDFRFRRNGVFIGATANENIENVSNSARATCYISGIFPCSVNDAWDLWAMREAGNTVTSAINLMQDSALFFRQL